MPSSINIDLGHLLRYNTPAARFKRARELAEQTGRAQPLSPRLHEQYGEEVKPGWMQQREWVADNPPPMTAEVITRLHEQASKLFPGKEKEFFDAMGLSDKFFGVSDVRPAGQRVDEDLQGRIAEAAVSGDFTTETAGDLLSRGATREQIAQYLDDKERKKVFPFAEASRLATVARTDATIESLKATGMPATEISTMQNFIQDRAEDVLGPYLVEFGLNFRIKELKDVDRKKLYDRAGRIWPLLEKSLAMTFAKYPTAREAAYDMYMAAIAGFADVPLTSGEEDQSQADNWGSVPIDFVPPQPGRLR